MWFKSEVWLDRRTTFTKTLGMMSIVGSILGLGDRHPNNLMLERDSGKIIHIDFGDCFEVTMTRDKYPERVPFRLTRMLINAMEVCGILGTFQYTCRKVMKVLREHKESLMAVLEAFVYDPLINWRLLSSKAPSDTVSETIENKEDSKEEIKVEIKEESKNNSRESRSAHFDDSNGTVRASMRTPAQIVKDEDIVPVETLNQRALDVIKRISNKLDGRDFNEEEKLDVNDQVTKLLNQATSMENLCQSWPGWLPCW